MNPKRSDSTDGHRTRRGFLKGLAVVGAGAATAGLAAACGPSSSSTVSPTAAASAAATSAAATRSAAPTAPTPARARFISWSTARVEQANIFIGQELGYYKDAALSFEYIAGQGSGDALKQLIAGNGDIAFSGPEGLFLAADEGADVVGVYNTYPRNIFVIISKKTAGILKPADLRGKKVGVFSLASGGRYNLITVLQANGMKESDVTLIASGAAPAPFLQGQIDAWVALTTTQASLEAQGQQVNVINCGDYADVPTDLFAMNRKDFDDPAKKDAAIRFLRAIRKGTELMIKDPAQAASISVKYALDVKEPAAAQPIIKEFARASQSPATDRNGLGYFDVDAIQKTADLYWKSGLIKKQLDVKKYFTNELIGKL